MTLARNPLARGTEPQAAPREGTVELARYEEYVRGLDEVPTLLDAVSPGPMPPPDFRSGERPDKRKDPRPDAWLLRESQTCEIELLYDEYSGGAATPPKKKPAKGKRAKGAKRQRKKKR